MANIDSNTISVLRNNGDGTFADDELYGTGLSPISVVIANLDGDDSGDLAVANFEDDTVSALLNQCITDTCPADLNDSGFIDLADLNLVLANFGQTSAAGDANGDGVVDLADLNAVLAAFGQMCP